MINDKREYCLQDLVYLESSSRFAFSFVDTHMLFFIENCTRVSSMFDSTDSPDILEGYSIDSELFLEETPSQWKF